ncbi:DUF805 domain-containing protein [Empedobacter brevis]|uniref:DUF805 domain-containing protein n=1 Tax=Empedobacter brevis TaxID=247 RepID=UPI00289EDE1C|nr:DUF805 domain-containing protein [Empedobacter brevis]
MIDWYKKAVFENYANFSGRARRSEYWYFVLCNFIITLILYIPMIIAIAINGNSDSPGALFYLAYGLLMIYAIATFIPSLAVVVRRLHDTGKSGWYYLIGLIPLVGVILLLIWLFSDSQPGSNNWGPNPKDLNDSINQIGSTGI